MGRALKNLSSSPRDAIWGPESPPTRPLPSPGLSAQRETENLFPAKQKQNPLRQQNCGGGNAGRLPEGTASRARGRHPRSVGWKGPQRSSPLAGASPPPGPPWARAVTETTCGHLTPGGLHEHGHGTAPASLLPPRPRAASCPQALSLATTRPPGSHGQSHIHLQHLRVLIWGALSQENGAPRERRRA